MPDSKHLDYLQAVITRMAGNSFLAKGWSITLGTAVIGLAAKDGGPIFALIGLLPVLLFWLVDAYYLTLERGFRDLFVAAAAKYRNDEAPDFEMTPAVPTPGTVLATAFRPAVLMIHLPIAAVLVVAYCWLDCLR